MTPVHDPTAKRFTLRADDGEAFVSYVSEGRTVVITHTLVPPAWRGRGVGAHLLHALQDWARAEGRPLLSRCDYASAFLRRQQGNAGRL